MNGWKRGKTFVRRMKKRDDGEVRELLARHEYECGKLYHPEREKELSLEYWREHLKNVPLERKAKSKVVVLVAEKDGELAGCAYLLIAAYGLAREAFVVEFYAEPEYRREISEKLVQGIKRHCLEEEHRV